MVTALQLDKMGAAGSVRRAAKEEKDQLHEKTLNREEELERLQGEQWAKSEASISQLLSEKHELAEELRKTRYSLQVHSDGWRRERSKATALMFSELPLSMMQNGSTDSVDGPGEAALTKTFPMVTLAQCDVVGFSSLTSRLQPQEAIQIIDHLHALIDEMFTHPDIFLMERTSSGCTAASGLVEAYPETGRSGASSQLSMTDSSYGSVTDLIDSKHTAEKTPNLSTTHASSVQHRELEPQQQTAAHFASLLASAALQFMSASTRIIIPRSENQQLQLRIALHAGPCSAGVVGLQTASGVSRIPHYKLFGLPLKYTHNLCMTGLALQIRVSKSCHELLASTGLFHFERCPDYTLWSAKKSIESFWLVGREGMNLTLPSLEHALSLTEYDDTEI